MIDIETLEIASPEPAVVRLPTPSESHVRNVAIAIMCAAGKPQGDWTRYRKQALAAVGVGSDPGAKAEDCALLRAVESELSEILSWGRMEAAPLREQELESIAGVLARVRGHMADVSEGKMPSLLRWIAIGEQQPKKSRPGAEFQGDTRHLYAEYVVLVPSAVPGEGPHLSIASYWGARGLGDQKQHDWYCPLTKDETLQPSHFLSVETLTAALASDSAS